MELHAHPGSFVLGSINVEAEVQQVVVDLQAQANKRAGILHTEPQPAPFSLSHDNEGRTHAHLEQSDVQPVRGIVRDMFKEPYAWSKAFPTVFRPTLHPDGKVCVHGDFSSWDGDCERSFDHHSWAKWLLQRGNGVPASHPIFSLVLHNEMHQKSLQQQGYHAL
jgi:hypothetical protein